MSTRSHGERARRHTLGVLLSIATLPCTTPVALAQQGSREASSTPPTAQAVSVPAAFGGALEPAPAPAADPYDQLIDSGVAEFASGHWAEARLLFERAHLLRPSARTLRALGMSAFNLHSYARALCELEGALASTEQPLDAAMRSQVELLARRATPLVGRFTITHTPASGTVTGDGHPPVRDLSGRLLLDIGRHTLALHATGYAPLHHPLEVHGGEDDTLFLRALPLAEVARADPPTLAHPRRRHRIRVLGLAAAGLASGAGGLASWLRADHHYDRIADDCRAQGGCFDDAIDLEHVRRLERTAYGLAGVGASLLLTSAVLIAIDLVNGDPTTESAP